MEISQYIFEKICETKSIAIISPDSKLRELGINSIEFIQIIVALETEYDFSIPDELLYFNDDTTVDDFSKGIKSAFEMKDSLPPVTG